jgi:hypothetical protein
MRISALINRDGIAGILFLVLGAATVVYARHYELGTLTEMGAGYFPTILGSLMMLSGAGIALAGFATHDDVAIAAPALRPVLAIITSVICFAMLLDDLGLPMTVFVTVIVACAARPGFLRLRVFALAAALAALCVLLFVAILNVPISLLPPAWQGL